MSKIIKIYCEGKSGSHDYDILEKVIAGLFVQIEPIGSIRGAGAIIQYKETEVVKSDFKIPDPVQDALENFKACTAQWYGIETRPKFRARKFVIRRCFWTP